MLVVGSANTNRSEYLANQYADLLNNGANAEEILVLVLNSYKKSIFVQNMKNSLKINHYENPKIYTFYGLAYNSLMGNWPQIQNTVPYGRTSVLPNLTGLEISQFFFKYAIKEVGFKDYNSKINLMHQLFRRYSLITNNNLNEDEVKLRADILKESFAQDAKTAIDLYKKKTIEYRAFDYLRQLSVFDWVSKHTDTFKNIKYLIVDDADEMTSFALDFVENIKQQCQKIFIGYDCFGTSRMGFLNADINTVERIERVFKDEEKINFDCPQIINKNFKTKSFSRRLEMIQNALSDIKNLVAKGIPLSEISVITPEIDSLLKFCIEEELSLLNVDVQYFSGSEKLISTICVKNAITMLKLSFSSTELDVWQIRSMVSSMLNIPVKYCLDIIQQYKNDKKLSFCDLKNDVYNEKFKNLTEVLEKISNKDMLLSQKVFIIYKDVVSKTVVSNEDLESFNFFMKQLKDFETVFVESANDYEKQKAFLTQLEKSIISENPSSAPELKDGAIIVSTSQKIIDYSISTDYQYWLDVSSSQWVKDDLGTLYNAWVFQKSWDKDDFTYEDNLNLSNIKTQKQLRKLMLLAKKDIFIYSALFDSQGNENFGGIEEYIVGETHDNSTVKDFSFVPREDQKNVLDYKNGMLSVCAVPGAGKTTILLALIIKLLGYGVKSENIFVLTYMDSAARNFKERIKKMAPDVDKMPNISTIHGLALRILKENANYLKVGLDNDFEVCDDTQKQKIIREIMLKMQIEQDDFDKYEKALSALKLCSAKSFIKSFDKEINKFLNFYKTYNLYLKNKNLIDYDDMLVYCVKILEDNSDIAEYYQNICQYVIEDEAQDSSAIQQRLLQILSKKHKNLIRCGDINQAITTTFTNADTKGFKNFIQNSKNVTMNLSQRCSKDVYTLANNLVKFAQNQAALKEAFFDIEMLPVEKKNPICKHGVISKVYENSDKERNEILAEIRSIFAKDNEASVAVLVRNNSQTEDYAAFFADYGLEVMTRNDYLGSNAMFAFVLSALDFCSHPWQNDQVVEVMNNLKHQKIINFSQNDFDTIKQLKSPFVLVDADNLSEKLSQLLWDLNYWLDNSVLSLDEFVLKVGESYYSTEIEKSNLYMISLLIKRLANEYKGNDILVEKMREISKKPLNKFKFFNNDERKETKCGTVQIMTYHKSKGDEFDYVFVPQLTEDNLPIDAQNIKIKSKERFIECVKALNSNYQKKDEPELKKFYIEENLRLLYVAITRAKKRLYISYSSKYKKYSKFKNAKTSSLFESVFAHSGVSNE